MKGRLRRQTYEVGAVDFVESRFRGRLCVKWRQYGRMHFGAIVEHL